MTQCDFRTFPNLSCVDGVVAMPHRLDALDVAGRESIRLVTPSFDTGTSAAVEEYYGEAARASIKSLRRRQKRLPQLQQK